MAYFSRHRLVVVKHTRRRVQIPRLRFKLATLFVVTYLVATGLVCGPAIQIAARHSGAYASWQRFKEGFHMPRPDISIKQKLDAWNEYYRESPEENRLPEDDLRGESDLYDRMYRPTTDYDLEAGSWP